MTQPRFVATKFESPSVLGASSRSTVAHLSSSSLRSPTGNGFVIVAAYTDASPIKRGRDWRRAAPICISGGCPLSTEAVPLAP